MSRSSSSSTQVTDVDTTNINLQDLEGINIAGTSGPVSIAVTDAGAIMVAGEIAESAIDANLDATLGIIDASSAAIETVADVAGESLDFGLESLEAVQQTQSEALGFGAGVLEIAAGIFERGQEASTQQVATTVGGLTEIARQQSTSEAQRVQQIAIIAVGALVAVFLLPRVLEAVQ